MAEKKTRILLRSDILANWLSVNPVLGKGEVAVVYDPAQTGERKIRLKVGDGVANFTALPFIADYDDTIASIAARLSVDEADILSLRADLTAEIARASTEEAKKVDKELVGDNGTAYIFNERDGGGARFVNKDGSEAFVGVNDGGKDGLMAQIYADIQKDGKWYGAKLDVTNEGMFYTVGDKTFAERAVEANEIATKGDVANVLPSIDASKYDKYLHTNAATGNLEWVYVEQGAANWGSIGGNIEAQADLMAKFSAIDDELADRYTKAETDTKIAEEIGKIKHWTYKVVQVLPTPSADCEHIIYLVPKVSGTGYKEYVCINEGTAEVPVWKFEEIGDTDIDLSDYRRAADQDVIDNEIKADISAEEARAKAEEAKKVNRELVGANGTSYIFNEADGGGSKFVDNAGAAAYVGTHDNIGGVTGVQIYADKDSVGSESTIIDVTKNGAYYNKGVIKPGSQRDVEANEIAVKGDIDVAVAEKEDKFDILDGGSAEDWSD